MTKEAGGLPGKKKKKKGGGVSCNLIYWDFFFFNFLQKELDACYWIEFSTTKSGIICKEKKLFRAGYP